MHNSNRKLGTLFYFILILFVLVRAFKIYFPDAPPVTDYKYFITYLCLFVNFLSLLLMVSMPFRRSVKGYLVVALILSVFHIYFYLNYRYLTFFGETLTFENLKASIQALTASVAGDDTGKQMKGIFKILKLHFAVNLLLLLIFRFLKRYSVFNFQRKFKDLHLAILLAILFVTSSLSYPLFKSSFSRKDIGYETFSYGMPYLFSFSIKSTKAKFLDKCILSKEFLNKEDEINKITKAHSLMSEVPSISRNNALKIIGDKGVSREALVKSNIKTFDDKEKTRAPNITFIMVEGFRSDMLNPEVTPNLMSFLEEKDVYKLDKLFSTGTSSTSGIHGLLSGLSDFYYPDTRVLSFNTLPVIKLAEKGYEINSWRAYDSKYDSYGSYFHDYYNKILASDLTESHKNIFRNNELYLNDKLLMDHFLKYWENNSSNVKPAFNYYLWFGSHYNYFYPPESAKFKPDQVEKLRIQSSGYKYKKVRTKISIKDKFKKGFLEETLKNRYMNSLYYFDQQLKPLLDFFKTQKNHILIIAGDHGEELWELGRFGHVFGLNRFQTQVAGLIKINKKGIQGDRLSTLADIFPTIFDYMGEDLDYMSGKSLYDANKVNRIISKTNPSNRVNYTNMVLTEDRKILFNSSSKCLRIKKITDFNDVEVDDMTFEEVKREIFKAKKDALIY